MKKFSRIAAALLAGLMLMSAAATFPVAVMAAEPTVYGGTPISQHQGGYDYPFSQRKLVTYAYDFSLERINFYASDPAIALGRTSGEIVDGALTSKEGKDCIFGSAVCLGDQYGLEATVPMPVSLGEKQTFTLHEGLDTLTLSVGDTAIAVVKYTEEGYLAFCDGEGNVKAETDQCKLYPTGYFSLQLSDITGYVDNVIFTSVEETWDIPAAESVRKIDYSTWTAHDALDRVVADNQKAGDPKDNRYVGLFYFLCWVGAGVHVQDNTKLYLEMGARDTVKYIEDHGGEAYWAEPYFGYYRNTDTWVYRKHAYMLEQAGVDFIYLDVSNAEVFIPGHTALFDTWLEMRREGIDTPQIVFFNGDTPATFQSNMKTLLTTVYADGNWEKYTGSDECIIEVRTTITG